MSAFVEAVAVARQEQDDRRYRLGPLAGETSDRALESMTLETTGRRRERLDSLKTRAGFVLVFRRAQERLEARRKTQEEAATDG